MRFEGLSSCIVKRTSPLLRSPLLKGEERNKMKKFIPIIFIFAIVLLFFKPLFIQKLLPVPSDTIVALYYPFRDLYAKNYQNGVPFKNFLITDPVRQQYPWRSLSIKLEKKL